MSKSNRRTGPTSLRAGFTLIELLVIIAIIGVLASLSLTAVFALRAAQMKRFTEVTVEKLTSALDQQTKALLDEIKQDEPDLSSPGNPIVQMANRDIRRARVIYNKVRLKTRFPSSFAEAITPTGVFPADAAYVRVLNGVVQPTDPDLQSSIVLFLALSQARRGMAAFKPEELDPTAIGTTTVVYANGQTKQMSYFKDAWEKPIRLFTYATGNDELQGAPYVNPNDSAQQLKGRDPLDPEGTLYAPDWVGGPLWAQFNARIHIVRPPDKTGVSRANYLIPVIASPGPDGEFGLDAAMATIDAVKASDNIYSYRLRRAGARGD